MECPHPDCERDGFAGENGVARHYGAAHEGSLAKVERECRNPDCDEVYEAFRSRLKNGRDTFCSRECRVSCATDFMPSGEDHVQYDASTHVERTCQECGDTWVMPQSRVNRADGRERGKFCSEECDAKWRSKNMRGENHPSWQGGCDPSRGSSWSRQRKLAWERAEYTCEHPDCDEDVDSIGRKPDTHHIVPFEVGIESGYFDNHEEANDLDNLIVLCPTHHRKMEPSKQLKTPM